MAKRHVVQYYLEIENQYLEMLENLCEFKNLLAENKITQDEFVTATQEIEALKANYERISYIMFLLNKPNKKSKQDVALAESWYRALSHASKEALIDENRDALCVIKDLIKKGKSRND